MDCATFYGRSVAVERHIPREIPSGSEDSELSDDEIDEPCTSTQLTPMNYDNDEYDTEDEIPLSQYITLKKPNKKNIKWKRTITTKNVEEITFQGNELLANNILQLNDPYKLFHYFFSENFIQETVRQTCIYSAQTNPNRPICLSIEELERFMGLLLWMSLIRQPTTRRYWSPQTRIPQVADVMPVNRFEIIKRFLHFSDNSIENSRSVDKILPVIDRVREACLGVPFEQNLSCDEQIISFKGRSRFKTYNPKKPHKWGYKMWVLSGVSGFSYNFELFAGKDGYSAVDNEPDLGAASNVVVRMSRPIPPNVHHKLYYDNYFSGMPLVAYLSKKKIHSVATVRTNRLPGHKTTTEKEMKMHGRGSFIEETAKFDDIDIHAVQWFDNKIVSLISDYCGTDPLLKVKRFFKSSNERKEIDCPDIVREYNRHMGGVDLQDSLLGLYPIKVKSKKWYHRIFYHMLDVVTINAWLLDRRIKSQLGQKDKIVPLLTFKTNLAEQLCNRGVVNPTRRGRPSSEIPEPQKKRRCLEARPNEYVQTDQYSHWPEWTEARERCKKLGCRGKARVQCKKCKVHLCFHSKSNCFVQFHVNLL